MLVSLAAAIKNDIGSKIHKNRQLILNSDPKKQRNKIMYNKIYNGIEKKQYSCIKASVLKQVTKISKCLNTYNSGQNLQSIFSTSVHTTVKNWNRKHQIILCMEQITSDNIVHGTENIR